MELDQAVAGHFLTSMNFFEQMAHFNGGLLGCKNSGLLFLVTPHISLH